MQQNVTMFPVIVQIDNREGLLRPQIESPMHSEVEFLLRFVDASGCAFYRNGDWWILKSSDSQSIAVHFGIATDRVVPAEFHIDSGERRVLNALGEGELTARAIGQILDLVDAVTFMEELTRKLESFGLDLVEPGEPAGGEPTYRFRR